MYLRGKVVVVVVVVLLLLFGAFVSLWPSGGSGGLERDPSEWQVSPAALQFSTGKKGRRIDDVQALGEPVRFSDQILI